MQQAAGSSQPRRMEALTIFHSQRCGRGPHRRSRLDGPAAAGLVREHVPDAAEYAALQLIQRAAGGRAAAAV